MAESNVTTAPTETRLALIHAAEARLMTEGWAALRMRDLAAAVGIRAPSIYHHFATKADLGLAVVDHLRSETQIHLDALTASHPTLRGRLDDFVAMLEGPDSCSKSCPLYNLQAEHSVLPEPMQAAIAELVDNILSGFAAWISEAEASGEIAHVCEPRSQACILFSIAEHGQQLRRVLSDVSVADLLTCWYHSLQTKDHA